jgi:hypothetical protein
VCGKVRNKKPLVGLTRGCSGNRGFSHTLNSVSIMLVLKVDERALMKEPNTALI